jgi:hypothetical protein
MKGGDLLGVIGLRHRFAIWVQADVYSMAENPVSITMATGHTTVGGAPPDTRPHTCFVVAQ